MSTAQTTPPDPDLTPAKRWPCEKLEALETRVDVLVRHQGELERRVAELEKNTIAEWPEWLKELKRQTPVIPPPDPWNDNDRCSVCGGLFKDMTHYVCTHPKCPGRVTFTS